MLSISMFRLTAMAIVQMIALGSYLRVHEEGNVAVGELEMCWMLQSNSSCCLSDS